MSRQKKIQLENGTILFLGAAAFILLAASLFPSSAMSQKVRSYLEMNRMVERAFAVMLLVLSTQLMKRKRTAWEMTMAVLTLSLLRNDWFYFGTDGKMLTGWQQIGGEYYYLNSDSKNVLGKMMTGWLSDGTNKYYMDTSSGKMAHGWKELEGSWYYFNDAGHMMTGWIQLSGVYYYLDPSTGKMAANTTLTIDGVSYTFASNGAYQNSNSNAPSTGGNVSAPGSGTNNTNAPGSNTNTNTNTSGGPGGSSTGNGNLSSAPGSNNNTPGGSSSPGGSNAPGGSSSNNGVYQLAPGLTNGPG